MVITYKLVRSSRKTLAVEIKGDGQVIVRAPYRISKREIDRFVTEKADWIDKHLSTIRESQAARPSVKKLTSAEIQALADAAMKDFPERVRRFAPKVGVTYGRITIRNQKTRWGSCSSKGNLNFNCLLMFAPPEVRDYVVVHELCHRLEMNHSARFWAEVERVLPDYKARVRWLKEHGSEIMMKMTG
jgi:predicted metal-dependent hydrolase